MIPAESMLVKFNHPLVTTGPRELVQTFTSLDAATQAAKLRKPNPTEAMTLHLGDHPMDPGGLLLLIRSLFGIWRDGWDTMGSGNVDVVNWVADNVQHMGMPRDQRKKIHRVPGDFLLRRVSSAGQMVEEVEEWAESVREAAAVAESIRASREQVALWATHVAEVTANAFQHSARKAMGSPTVLLAGRMHGRTAQLAAVDFGATIPVVIAPHAPQGSWDSGRLIRYACRAGVTSRCSRTNQGMGLTGLVRAVRRNGGRLGILSGSGMVHLANGRLRHRTTKNMTLNGTLVLITFTI